MTGSYNQFWNKIPFHRTRTLWLDAMPEWGNLQRGHRNKKMHLCCWLHGASVQTYVRCIGNAAPKHHCSIQTYLRNTRCKRYTNKLAHSDVHASHAHEPAHLITHASTRAYHHTRTHMPTPVHAHPHREKKHTHNDTPLFRNILYVYNYVIYSDTQFNQKAT